MGFPGGTVVKNPPANAGDARDTGSIPGSGRSSRVGNGNSLQYPCLENSMDRETWWATVHGVTKNQTLLSIHMQCDYNMEILVFGHCNKIKKYEITLIGVKIWSTDGTMDRQDSDL